VVPPARSDPAWAAPSMPTASPETTVAPTAATVPAMRDAVARPSSVGRRVPTIATARSVSRAAMLPTTNRTGGGSSIRRSLDG